MIITTSAEKGGVGKSTVAMILASELHRMEYAVLVVDTDPQGTVREWADIASDSCESFPAVITMGDNLSRQLPGIADRYDVTIVDCAGTDNRALRRALSISDLALVPCGASAPEMFGIKRTLRIIDEARDANPHLDSAIVANKIKRGTVIGASASEQLRDLGHRVLSAELSNLVAFEEFPATGMGVSQYAAGTKAAKEAQALTAEILALISTAPETQEREVA